MSARGLVAEGTTKAAAVESLRQMLTMFGEEAGIEEEYDVEFRLDVPFEDD